MVGCSQAEVLDPSSQTEGSILGRLQLLLGKHWGPVARIVATWILLAQYLAMALLHEKFMANRLQVKVTP